MRTWVRWTGIAAFGLLASTALAADHTDGSADGLGTDANPDADISDVYAWAKDDGHIVLIMNIVGDFSDATQYAFHVGRTDAAAGAITAPAADVTDVICEFDAGGAIQCWVGDGAYVTGDPTADAGIESTDGSIKVHANAHADPFYFNLEGFSTAIATANAAAAALQLDAAGCPTNLGTATIQDLVDAGILNDAGACNANDTVSSLLLGLLNGTYADAACAAGPGANGNSFANNNVRSLVLEVDGTLFEGTGDYLQVWASTHQKN